MSDEGQDVRNTVSGAEATRVRAADWILAKRLAKTWSETDQAALDVWLEESLTNRLAYLRLDAAWGRARRLAALRPLNRGGSKSPRGQRRPFLLRIAVAVVVIGALGVAIGYSLQPSMKTYGTVTGNRETVTLADGSTIELNTDTVLRVSDDPASRIATLDKGEAYFHIKHDPSRPFSVFAAGHRVTDLGTEFVIRSDANHLTVALLEGRARFESTDIWSAHQSAMLSPGDIVEASGNSMSMSKQPVPSLSNKLAWRRGVLVFENATLADAAKELNRYNAKKVVITDDAVARLKFDASIPTGGVDVFTRVARQVFGLRVETHEDEVVISR